MTNDEVIKAQEKAKFLERAAMLVSPATLTEAYVKNQNKYACQHFKPTQWAAEQAYLFAEALYHQDQIRKEINNG